MMTPSLFSAEDLPDLPHARQLQTGFPWLYFDPQLERQFRRSHLDDILVHVRTNLGLAIALVVAFVVGNAVVFGRELGHIPNTLNLFVKLPVLLLALAASFAPKRDRVYLPFATAAVIVCGLSQVASLFVESAGGAAVIFPNLILTIMYAYLMCGLIFYYAAAANLVIVLAYLGTASVVGAPGTQLSYGILSIVAANLIGATALYMYERTSRMRFLEAGLLGEMVARDGLTGIHNRRMFDQHMQRAWSQAVRDSEFVAVLLVDIDCFKDYNDRYGHQAGDECLRAVAVALNQCARRPMDFVARYGGEEFAVVLYEASSDYVSEVLTRIQRSIAELNIPHEASPVASRLTVSIGAACIEPTAQRSVAGLIQLADEALYNAKDQGRNRVVVMEAEYQSLTTGRFNKRRKRDAA
jgi:diguanylate cyclase (GGDEF)-like protein